MNEKEYEQTARDYLNNWRETQARVSELEAEIAELSRPIQCSNCGNKYEFVYVDTAWIELRQSKAENAKLEAEIADLRCMLQTAWNMSDAEFTKALESRDE